MQINFAVDSRVIVKKAQIINKTKDSSVQALAMSKFEFGWKSANLRLNAADDVAQGVWSLPSAKMNRVKGAHYASNEWIAGVL